MREQLQITSVNIGKAELVARGSEAMQSGICKRPVYGPVHVSERGLDGDKIVDGRYHGGLDQAVYAYSVEDYDWWGSELDREMAPGLFGENLTIKGLPGNMVIGDRLLIGDVVLEATAARIPCAKLAARVGDPGFGLAFRKAERPGVYFRVLNPGEVESGDSVTLVESGIGTASVLDLFRFAYETNHDAEKLRRLLEAPLAERVRLQIEKKLSSL